MKKLCSFLVLFIGVFTANSQIVNIPDANFKAKLLAASSAVHVASTSNLSSMGSIVSWNVIDINGDGEIQVSEAQNIKCLEVTYSNITNLTGIEAFTNLQYLNCRNNQLISLSVNNLSLLQRLFCHVNELGSLNVSNLSNLIQLQCNSNNLTSLNVAGLSNLESLNCSSNPLTSVNTTGLSSLKGYSCSSTNISSLNVSALTTLTTLFCQNSSALHSLNVTGLTNLIHLWCDESNITSLNASGLTNLEYLYCQGNALTYLNVSGSNKIKYLHCYSNYITGILDISNLTNLYEFKCNASMTELYMKNGAYDALTLSQAWPNNLQYVCVDESELSNVQTKVSNIGITNCQINSYCSFVPGGVYYTIQGNNRYDIDNNSCDATDIPVPNLRLNFYNGTTNTSSIASEGQYFYNVPSGTQTMTPLLENPSYFNVTPNSAIVSFPSQSSPFNQNFCITANGIHNDLEITLIPTNNARPGFDAVYKIVYKNKGTAIQSGTVSLNYDDSKMDYVLSTPSFSTQELNSISWNFTNLAPFESRQILLVLNINSPTETPAVINGDVLQFTSNIFGLADETPIDNTATLNQTVVGSYDPNDKTCVEGTSISPSMVGQYVHYVIRFENTGTFAAENIVVKDMIDTAKFDINSLVPLSSSHLFATRISNTNRVEFIFENINLPFDEANNDGYVAFKIKTKPTLVVGNSFSNSASIYFDYNFPIVTDTYTTTIQALSNQDFEFSSVFSLSPVPTKDVLTITAKETVVMSSVSIYNTLGQLVQVITNPSETIDVSGLSSGSYFIKIMSDRGSATGKFIKSK